MQILNINDTMPFGKYKGIKIEKLINEWHFLNSPQNYLNWAINNWKNIEFSEEVKKAIKHNQKELSELQSENERIHPKEKNKSYKGDFGAFSCPGDYMGMGPSDFGIPYC
jgi:hypothetical protein